MNKIINISGFDIIDEGASGYVFRLSRNRILKIFKETYSDKEIELLILDEIKGSLSINRALPVIKVVSVKDNERLTRGLIKRFIPYPVSKKEYNRIIKEDGKSWDDHINNFRKDSYGNIFKVDTQTSKSASIHVLRKRKL